MGKHSMTAVALALSLGAIVSGMVQAQPAEPANTIIYGVPKPAPLVAQWSSGNVLGGGLISGLMALSDGKALAEKHNVVDPAAAMAPILAARLAARAGYALSDSQIAPTPKTKDSVALLASKGRYAVGVGTVQRRVIWYPTNWTHYSIIYWARFYVLDTRASRIVVQDLCKWTSPREGAPSRDELMADDAKRLKAAFADGQAACLARFEGVVDTVALDPPPSGPAFASAPMALATQPLPTDEILAPPPRVDMAAIAATGATAMSPSSPPAEAREQVDARAAEPPFPPVGIIEASPLRPAVVPPYAPPTAPPIIDSGPPSARVEYRVAGRDENGYLVWPGKRP